MLHLNKFITLSGISRLSAGSSEADDTSLEKFAVLVIEECLIAINDAKTTDSISKHIQEHFGLD